MTCSRVLTITSFLVFACWFSTIGTAARTYEETAEMLFKNGHREDAVRVLGEAIKKRPKSGYLFATRGRYLLQGENYGLALDDLTKAIAIDPSFRQAWIYRMRADCHVNLGNYAAAISDLKTAIALKPQDEYYKMLGEVYYQQKRFDEAIDSLTKGIAMNGKNYWLYVMRGDIYFQQQKFKKAVDEYTAVIRIIPNEPVGYGSRAKAYEKLGLHALADKDLARAKKENDVMGDLMK